MPIQTVGRPGRQLTSFWGKPRIVPLNSYNLMETESPLQSCLLQAFNNIFLGKVQNLTESLIGKVTSDPSERLSTWLEQRSFPIEEFNLKEIDLPTLSKYLKKLKGNRSSAIDQIDSFSLKLSAPPDSPPFPFSILSPQESSWVCTKPQHNHCTDPDL